MDSLIPGTILSRKDWDDHISRCEAKFDGPHKGIVGKGIIISVDVSCPSTPFLCYSLYQENRDLDDQVQGEWLHFCFVPAEAAYILANAEEDMVAQKEKIREELKTQRPERLRRLEEDMADLDDVDPDEDLGTIGG